MTQTPEALFRVLRWSEERKKSIIDDHEEAMAACDVEEQLRPIGDALLDLFHQLDQLDRLEVNISSIREYASTVSGLFQKLYNDWTRRADVNVRIGAFPKEWKDAWELLEGTTTSDEEWINGVCVQASLKEAMLSDPEELDEYP